MTSNIAVSAESLADTPRSLFAISYELAACVALVALSLALRIAELDTVPLTNLEAHQALAAWRALHPNLPGSVIVPESPLLFLLHGIGFSIFGGAEFAVRLFTALAGTGLVMMPLLFRDVLGRARAFAFSLMLAFSPVLLVASRFDSPVVWTLLSAGLLLWALRRWWLSQNHAFALAAGGFSAALLLLTDPAGWWFGLALAGAAAVALAWNRVDNPEDDALPEMRQRLRNWPGLQTLLAAGLTLFVIATAFMFYLPGLSAVSHLLQTGLTGLVTPQPGAPLFFGLLTAFFYEPLIWVFGLVGLWLLARQGALALVDRFLAAWSLLAGVGLLVYQGSGPAHALWLLLPLTGLAAGALVNLLQREKHPFLDVPPWSKPVLAVGLCALLAILAINLQSFTRLFLQTPDGVSLAFDSTNLFNLSSLGWMIVVGLFIIVGYFLASSVWGGGATLRGGALGLLAFGLVTSLGNGWNAAVTHAANPVEFWHIEASGQQTRLLRDTLLELARRETGGFPFLTVYAQADDAGIVGWLLRDFVDVRYISQPNEAAAQGVVLLQAADELPDLGGSYVGQQFVITRVWNPGVLLGYDVLPWWLQRRVRSQAVPAQTLVLWLRQDIYDGVEFDPTQQ